MHPSDRFALFVEVTSALLAEHSGRISDADLDELADVIAQCAWAREGARAGADLQRLDEWLSQFAMRLRARHFHETEGD
jgi:hypothetical protein